ncbi:DNA-binding transcriptional regulator, MerR family [Paenibacillus algorifonticola]|uniref:DNA-binding transcriptional regulator, MerR family n=1 Tax=Paenibacillus algorifonticola TaxID=684063 RepID=A0A1I2GPH3_9BACL|nr:MULTISPECIES: MerR family DNA-binding transcriptional regulator [Paenibacillus]KQO15734.1 MerR family transcriptional regulator [Paenibacillus sp. Leaf72]SFF18501.1 DNA-binding transcriptional regulator, MerR family [Paenibacillus algorifonticola]
MTNTFTPVQIANELKISTTTLRRYEEQGLLPDVPRTIGNHRSYLPIHFQAFITIRSLLRGYDIPIVYEVMRKIKNGDQVQALWLVNNQLYLNQVEKQRVEEILMLIKNADFSKYRNVKMTNAMTIGKVAEMAGVNTSAIRHWEKEGLIQSERDKENGYRIFTVPELRKILVISSLRKTIYYIENMKELLKAFELQSYPKVDQAFQLALQNLNEKLILQFKGAAQLMKYIDFYTQGE